MKSVLSQINTTVFFQPDNTFVKWLADYAGNRIIFDIGCGTGHLMRQLRDVADFHRTVGIEPFFDNDQHLENLRNEGAGAIRIYPWRVQDPICSKMIKEGGSKILLVFARPCHSNFVCDTLAMKIPETEALYITKPRNLIEYNDLGKFEKQAVKIRHQGTSEDNEVVYSIK